MKTMKTSINKSKTAPFSGLKNVRDGKQVYTHPVPKTSTLGKLIRKGDELIAKKNALHQKHEDLEAELRAFALETVNFKEAQRSAIASQFDMESAGSNVLIEFDTKASALHFSINIDEEFEERYQSSKQNLHNILDL